MSPKRGVVDSERGIYVYRLSDSGKWRTQCVQLVQNSRGLGVQKSEGLLSETTNTRVGLDERWLGTEQASESQREPKVPCAKSGRKGMNGRCFANSHDGVDELGGLAFSHVRVCQE